ncbi:MAG: hypothetical protein ACFFG0_51695 [Candidatus Thorarchaeota archaeon]
MNKNNEILKLAEGLQNDIYNDSISVTNIVRKTLTIAQLLNRTKDVEWLQYELNGYEIPSEEIEELKKCDKKLSKKNIMKEREWYKNLGLHLIVPDYRSNVIAKFQFVPQSFEDIALGYTLDSKYRQKEIFITYPIYLIEERKDQGIILDTGNDKVQGIILKTDLKNILNQVKNRVLKLINEIIIEIKYSQIPYDIFEESKKIVDNELMKVSPETFKTLISTYEKLKTSKSTEDFSQIAHLCRRILMSFADSVDPYINKQSGNELTKQNYINRIMNYISQITESETNKKLMEASVKYINDFIKTINKLANKGEHDKITKDDANRCIIYTYLIIGDIIKFAKKEKIKQ